MLITFPNANRQPQAHSQQARRNNVPNFAPPKAPNCSTGKLLCSSALLFTPSGQAAADLV